MTPLGSGNFLELQPGMMHRELSFGALGSAGGAGATGISTSSKILFLLNDIWLTCQASLPAHVCMGLSAVVLEGPHQLVALWEQAVGHSLYHLLLCEWIEFREVHISVITDQYAHAY